eukprot:g593.t1
MVQYRCTPPKSQCCEAASETRPCRNLKLLININTTVTDASGSDCRTRLSPRLNHHINIIMIGTVQCTLKLFWIIMHEYILAAAGIQYYPAGCCTVTLALKLGCGTEAQLRSQWGVAHRAGPAWGAGFTGGLRALASSICRSYAAECGPVQIAVDPSSTGQHATTTSQDSDNDNVMELNCPCHPANPSIVTVHHP